MNESRVLLSLCTGVLLSAISAVVAAQTAPANSGYGRIHFNNDKGEEKCTLAVPEDRQTFSFNSNDEYCENNMVSSFWLENVPSATLIQLFENEACSANQDERNFYFLLKTVKQPTDWSQAPNPPDVLTIDQLRNAGKGELLVRKYTRVEDAFVGSELSDDNLNERLSCVYIERSQPVN